MEKISYKLSDFEGPLDLLLHLIAKNKLNICDIQISELLEQYLEHIETMRELDMDISSEFLEMAARLVYIKAVSLLPKNEEAEELKLELTGQLLEYQECKKIAVVLSQKINFDTFIREFTPVEYDMTYTRTHNSDMLAAAYINAVGRGKNKLPPPKTAFSGIVERKIVSVSSKIIGVMRKLWSGEEVDYESLFSDSGSKSEMVAIFLAVLELVKGKRVRIDDNSGTNKLKIMNGGGKRGNKRDMLGD